MKIKNKKNNNNIESGNKGRVNFMCRVTAIIFVCIFKSTMVYMRLGVNQGVPWMERVPNFT